jgi:radical SAM superfamily enzyme YgiQ (UPF0313 family)
MKLTLIQPCIGRRVGQAYIRSWQMEPLPPATIAGLTPEQIEIAFYDDRMEAIPFDEPTDLVAISVETYTARRTYQIATEYRKRDVPVVMGGFHATLCPEEVSQYADSVVVGEAENIWECVLDDAQRKTLRTYYHASEPASLKRISPDRSIYRGKRYLPVSLVEAGRGCMFSCDFCAIQVFFQNTHRLRPPDRIVSELVAMRRKPLIFFVDDNITVDHERAKDFFRELIPLNLRWVSQVSIDVGYDEELLELMAASGCQGVLIGFESLNPATLSKMKKGFNLQGGGYEKALATLRKFNLRLYITFLYGYDEDTELTFEETLDFALKYRFYIAAFNHVTPFPGTPLYERLEKQGRMLYDAWWLDERYRYTQVPFQPLTLTPERVQLGCIHNRSKFYNWRNIWARGLDPVNRSSTLAWFSYYWINAMFHQEVHARSNYPLGDEAWQGQLIPVRQRPTTFIPGESG